MKIRSRIGNGRNTTSATTSADKLGVPPVTSCDARTYAPQKSGANAQSRSVCTLTLCPTPAMSTTTNGRPSGTTAQNLLPYRRIDSAMSCPTVRSAGGSAAGRLSATRERVSS